MNPNHLRASVSIRLGHREPLAGDLFTRSLRRGKGRQLQEGPSRLEGLLQPCPSIKKESSLNSMSVKSKLNEDDPDGCRAGAGLE
jgi:hypothetical protein